MLFWIDSWNEDAAGIAALENLLTSHREGKHIVGAERNGLHLLSRLPGLSSRAQGAARDILARWSEIRGLSKTVKIRIDVGIGAAYSWVNERRGNADVVKVPLDALVDSWSIQPSILVGENLTDCNVYSRLAMLRMVSHRGWNIQVRFQFSPGGGSQCHRNFTIAASGRLPPCICIIDSDRKSPASAIGSTAAQFSTSDNAPTARFFIMRGRELECILPAGIVRCAVGGEALTAYQIALTYVQSGVLNEIAYMDLKDGLTIAGIENIPDCKPEKNYWVNAVDKARRMGLFSCKGVAGGCTGACSCYFVPKCGQFLEAVSEYLCSHLGTRHRVADSEWDQIADICDILIDWGCAFPKKAA